MGMKFLISCLVGLVVAQNICPAGGAIVATQIVGSTNPRSSGGSRRGGYNRSSADSRRPNLGKFYDTPDKADLVWNGEKFEGIENFKDALGTTWNRRFKGVWLGIERVIELSSQDKLQLKLNFNYFVSGHEVDIVGYTLNPGKPINIPQWSAVFEYIGARWQNGSTPDPNKTDATAKKLKSQLKEILQEGKQSLELPDGRPFSQSYVPLQKECQDAINALS